MEQSTSIHASQPLGSPPRPRSARLRALSRTVWLHASALAAGLLAAGLVPGCGAHEDPPFDDPEEVAESEEAITAGTNLAQGKAATQSSLYSADGVASHAVDGNVSGKWTDWSVTHTAAELSPWWQVDLGASSFIGTVELYNRTDCCSDRLSNFKLLVSDDGTNWQSWDYPGAAGARVSFAVNRAARHVRVQLNSTGVADRILSLAEVKVFAPPNLALNKAATQSSTYSSAGQASNAVDGNTSGAWGDSSVTHTQSELSPWWQVDLGSVLNAGTIELYNRTDCCSDRLSDFKLLVSRDGLDWQSWSYPGIAGSKASFVVNRSARYVKVQLNSTGAANRILSLAEVRVYAAANASSGSSLPSATTLQPTAPVGAVEGKFDVDAQGSANYTIPIQVPPGTQGMEPRLSLVYRSGGGNGLTGVGWALAGVPMVTRCPRTQAQDGVTAPVNAATEDGYCLDGQRLIPVSGANGANGTEYRTEKETFSRVISYGACGNGPCTFQVTDKSGAVAQFGGTAGARQTFGSTATIRVWSLSKLMDRNGNYLTVSYTSDSGQLYPLQVLYTMNDGGPALKKRSVSFTYEGRPDVERAYVAGHKILTGQRLSSVKTFVEDASGQALVRDYRLAYTTSTASKRSLIASITECDGKGVCLPATSLEYSSDGPDAYSAETMFEFSTPAGWQYQDALRYDPGAVIIPGDFNGDGRTDFLREERASWEANDANQLWVYLSNGDGTFNIQTPHCYNGAGWDMCQSDIKYDAGAYLYPGDFNGDGKTDFIRQEHGGWDDDATNTFRVYLSSGDGQFSVVNILPAATDSLFQTWMRYDAGVNLVFGDYNGDGRTDFLRQDKADWDDDNGGDVSLYTANGDGTFSISHPSIPEGNGWDWFYDGMSYDDGAYLYPGDFNGDGMTDFLRQEHGDWDDDAGETLQVFFSKGNGQFTKVTPHEYIGSYDRIQEEMRYDDGAFIITGDYNGDGKTDFIRMEHGDWAGDTNGTFQVYFSRGDGGFEIVTPASQELQTLMHGDHIKLSTADFNGDGKADLLRQGSETWNAGIPVTVWLSNGDGTFEGLAAPMMAWQPSPYVGSYTEYTNLFSTDPDGDGKSDLLWQDKGTHDDDLTSNFRILTWRGDDALDMMKKVTTGLGGVTTIEYKPLTSSAVYTKGTTPVGGLADVQSPMYVVKSYKTSNNPQIGGTPAETVDHSFTYSGARADRAGRGFAGFEKVTQKNETLGSVTTVEYNQWPFALAGTVKSRTVSNIGGTALVKTSYTYSTSTTYAGVHLTAPTREEVLRTEGPYSYKTVKEFEYDAFGNVAILHDRGLDGDAADDVDTCTIYSGDPYYWRLDFPTYTRVAASCSISGGACQCSGVLNWVDRYYNWTNMNVQEVYELDDRYGRWPYLLYTYDVYGNVLTRSTPGKAGPIVEKNTWDPDYRTFAIAQTKTGGPLSQTSTAAYDPRSGKLVSRTDTNGNTTLYELDGLGRAVGKSETSPDGVLTAVQQVIHASDSAGAYIETRSRDDWTADTWRWKKEYLDQNGRIRRIVSKSDDPNNSIIVERTFDGAGQVASETLPYFANATPVKQLFSRDWLGRLTLATDAAGAKTKLTYSIDTSTCALCADRVAITEAYLTAKQRTWVRHDDVAGKVRRQVDPEQRATEFGYDRLERRTSIVEAAGTPAAMTTTTVYDSLGRVTSVLSPDRGLTYNEYGPDHWLSSTTDGRGLVTTYSYDDLGRVTQKQTAGFDAVTYTYDDPARANAAGRLTSVTVTPSGQSSPSSSHEFSYAPSGAVATNVMTIDGHAYTLTSSYDPAGRLRSLKYPDNTVIARAYSAQGALSQIHSVDTSTGGVGTVYAQYGSFNANGQPGSVTYANGTSSALTYDSALRLTSAATSGPGNASLLSYQYAWDPFYQITQITDNRDPSRTQTFTYSASGQLTQATGVYGSLSYAYDASGNMTTKDGASYAYTHHRVTSGTGFSASYDAAGNRISQSRGGDNYQYIYGAGGQVTMALKNSAVVGQFGYGFDGERVKKDAGGTVTYYVTPAFEVTILPDGRRLETKYINGPSGRVAAITEELAAGAGAMLDFRGLDSAKDLYDTRSAAGLYGIALHQLRAWRAHPQAPLAGGVALALALAAASVALARRRAPERLAAAVRALRAVVLPEKTAYVRRHPVFAYAAPIVAAAFLAACGNAPGGETFHQTQQELTPGANGEGNPIQGTYYFHQNHIGSASVITDSAGAEKARAEYKPYGEIVQSASPGQDIFRSKFTGKEWDTGSELYYFNARYYDPITGRFTSPDSHLQGGDARETASANPYAYANNSPVIYTDPSGRFFWFIIIVAVIVGMYAGGMSTNGGSWNPASWNWSSWQTYVGMGVGGIVGGLAGGAAIGVGGALGAMVGTAMNSLALNGLKFLSAEGSDWKSFLIGVGTDMAIGALMAGASAGPKDQLASTFKQRIANQMAVQTTKGLVAGELAKGALDVGVNIGMSIAEEQNVQARVMDGLKCTASAASKYQAPPAPRRVDESPSGGQLSRLSDALLGATGADVPGRSWRDITSRRRPRAGAPAFAMAY